MKKNVLKCILLNFFNILKNKNSTDGTAKLTLKIHVDTSGATRGAIIADLLRENSVVRGPKYTRYGVHEV